MYTIISTIEEAIHSKKQQIRYQAEERTRIENEMDRNRKDIACLEQELEQLKTNLRQIREPLPQVNLAGCGRPSIGTLQG